MWSSPETSFLGNYPWNILAHHDITQRYWMHIESLVSIMPEKCSNLSVDQQRTGWE